MLASEIITEEWLVDVLDDSMEMDWTTADGARAIMSALKAGLIRLPQTGGQIAHVASTKDRVLAVEILAQAFERSGDNRSATMVREAEANSKLRKSYCTPLHMEVALDALVIMRALEMTFGYRPPSGDQGPVAVGQSTQPVQIGDADAGEVVKRPSVHREAEGVCLDHRVQAAWDAVSTLPPITFSEQEANALASALAPAPAGDGVEAECDKRVVLVTDDFDRGWNAALSSMRDHFAALARPRAAVECSCAEIAGEDPDCGLHGTDTLWAKENPDVCEWSERIAEAKRIIEQSRAAVGERDKPEPQAWGDRECSGCTLPRRDCECN